MELLSTSSLLTLALVLVVVPKVWEACRILIWRRFSLSRTFRRQGVSGPGYKLFYGNVPEIRKMQTEARASVLDPNSHDIFPRVLPHYHAWMSQYGNTFLHWNGREARVCISDPELVKQILSNKFGFYGKIRIRPELITLAGNGLVFVEAHDWVRHKRIINPAFSIDKLKIMTKPVGQCTAKMFQRWKEQQSGGETQAMMEIPDMDAEFQRVTADVIAITAFGSTYEEAVEAFQTQRAIAKCGAVSLNNIFIPGFQYLPTPLNIQMWKLDRKLKKALKTIIDKKLNSKPKNSDSDYGDDVLGLMLAAAKSNESKLKMRMHELIDECKTFLFSGHETTSNLLTWMTMLLSLHQDWQEKLRDEVLKACGKTSIPDADTLHRFKLMSMVLMETLRLYCPIILLARKPTKDMKLGNLNIPKDTTLMIPLVKMHRDKEIWGEDANEFRPLRFANGVTRAAKHPNAFIAFSVGPRACLGQNFAMIEAKTIMAMILQRFRFSLADDYKHAPADNFTLQPQFGLPVNLLPL